VRRERVSAVVAGITADYMGLEARSDNCYNFKSSSELRDGKQVKLYID